MRTVVLKKGKLCERFQIPSVEAWGDFAQVVAKCLRPGDIVALSGELGAGKTTFVQALARALSIRRVLQSPTFALLRSYRLPRAKNGIHRLVHVDAYRIENERELLALDLDEELADAESLLVLEWPERVKNWVSAHAASVTTLSIK
ncbi:MAG: tRNA (adenosine(37)-N6)-threonylcarbamoyltransferase complex ATPase subunit type 1 TsaE [Patescibacteria group bacterium]